MLLIILSAFVLYVIFVRTKEDTSFDDTFADNKAGVFRDVVRPEEQNPRWVEFQP